MSYETVERSPSLQTVTFIEATLSREALEATVRKTFLILPNRGEGDEFVGIALSSWESREAQEPVAHYRAVGVVTLNPVEVLECKPVGVSESMLERAVLRYTVRIADPTRPYGAFAFEEDAHNDVTPKNVIAYQDIERRTTGPEASAFHEKVVSLLPPVSLGKAAD